LTPQEHNKYLGLSHIVYGAATSLMGLLMVGMFAGVLGSAPGGPPVGMMVFLMSFIAAMYGLMTIPSFIAGYALLKKKSWAKTAAIIGGVTAAMNFPLGTAVCVYTFWFLFSAPGKAMFEKSNYLLPPGRQFWANEAQQQRQEQSQYVPPPTPPDWR
jgi:hypothetical protein